MIVCVRVCVCFYLSAFWRVRRVCVRVCVCVCVCVKKRTKHAIRIFSGHACVHVSRSAHFSALFVGLPCALPNVYSSMYTSGCALFIRLSSMHTSRCVESISIGKLDVRRVSARMCGLSKENLQYFRVCWLALIRRQFKFVLMSSTVLIPWKLTFHITGWCRRYDALSL